MIDQKHCIRLNRKIVFLGGRKMTTSQKFRVRDGWGTSRD